MHIVVGKQTDILWVMCKNLFQTLENELFAVQREMWEGMVNVTTASGCLNWICLVIERR